MRATVISIGGMLCAVAVGSYEGFGSGTAASMMSAVLFFVSASMFIETRARLSVTDQLNHKNPHH